jgi:hypothetical protein
MMMPPPQGPPKIQPSGIFSKLGPVPMTECDIHAVIYGNLVRVTL